MLAHWWHQDERFNLIAAQSLEMLERGGLELYIEQLEESSTLPEAEFKIQCASQSAHSGGASYVLNANNAFLEIKGRSVNPVANTKVHVLVLG